MLNCKIEKIGFIELIQSGRWKTTINCNPWSLGGSAIEEEKEENPTSKGDKLSNVCSENY